MNLWNMSISGGILIVVIVILRSLFRNQLPGKVFQVLWLAAFLRLMIPFAIPWQFSIYSLAEKYMADLFVSGTTENDFSGMEGEAEQGMAVYDGEDRGEDEAAGMSPKSVWMFIYPAGAALSALYYIGSYVRWHREFQTALPIEEAKVQAWAEALPIRRRVTIRQWEMTATPLTYGIFHPVILLPKELREVESEQLRFMLLHEYMHIRHFDALKKMFLTLSCCIHWFNPLVWAMLILANRDMELDCDERVIRTLGGDVRSAYAYTLIDMEEQKGCRMSWGNSFCKNAMEERVVAIMKGKKKSIVVGVLAGILSAGIIMVFATSASAVGRMEQDDYAVAHEGIGEAAYYVDHINEAVASDTVSNVSEQADAATTEFEDDETEAIYNASEQMDETTVMLDDEAIYSVSEENSGSSVPEVPVEYASYGITVDAHTGAWKYQGKNIAVFYDRDIYTLANSESTSTSISRYDSSSGKDAVYLEVCRDKNGKIEEIKEVSKKEMQLLLSHTGLVF